jgi:hypothetical protein
VTTGEWGDEKKNNIPNDKEEVIINGVCVMNQSDYKSNDEDEGHADQSLEDGDDKLTIAEENDEDDDIKKSFIKKPSGLEKDDDVTVKKEVDESSAWEY